MGCVGGPCDYGVSLSAKNWFLRLGLDIGSKLGVLLGQGIEDIFSSVLVNDIWYSINININIELLYQEL